MNKIYSLYTSRDISSLEKLKNDLQIQKMNLDKFMTKYLDKFSNKMSLKSEKDPIWLLYKDKLKLYSSIEQEIRSIDYYVQKLK